MSKVDEELTRRFERAERRVGSDDLFERLARRRRRRRTLQRVQSGALAALVLGATTVGFVALRSAFREQGRTTGGETILSANGEIVFSRKGDDGRFHLFAVQPDGSGERQITSDATNDTDPAVSPDGQTIAYVHELDREPRIQVIATVPIDGGIVTWHTPDDLEASDPAWSSDGSTIAFVGWAEQSVPPDFEAPERFRAIFVVDAADLTPRRITDGGISFTADPSWSPDDRSIAIAGGSCALGCESAIESDLYLVDPSTTDGRRLTPWTPEVFEQAPTWSPDGTRIAFTRAGEQGDEVWTVAPDGTDETLIATAVEASLEPDLAWAPDGTALLVSDGEWIYRVDTTPNGDPRDNFVQLMKGFSPSWQPLPAGSEPSATATPELSVSPSPEPEGKDVGLGFNLCHTERLGGIDFLGDGTKGTAWTGTKVNANGTCPDYGGRFGVAVDFTGDGVADSWSGETMPYCVDCSPWKAADLNSDGSEELIVVVQGGTEIEFGLYTVRRVESGADPAIRPFRVGEPGHEAAGFVAGEPFTFWAGGDEGRSESVYCETLPIFWLTSISSLVDGGVDSSSTVHETQVEIGTDGAVHILDTRTTQGRYPEDIQAPYVTTGPACGIDFNWWQ